MEWFDEFLAALSGGGGSELDAAMMAAGSTPVSYNPADYGGLDAAMMAAGSTPVSYGGASAGTPFYLDPRFLQGAGSLIGGVSQAYAGQRAAGAQVDAANRAADLLNQNYLSMAARNQGAETLGNLARNRYGELVGLGPNTNAMGYGSAVQPFDMSKFQADPGYEYRLAESQKAEDRIASRNRNLFGSAALANAQRNRQGMASQEFGNAYNRYRQNRADQLDPLMYAMTSGTNATNATNTALGNTGTNVANLIGQTGQATGAGYLGAGSSINNLAGALSNQYNTNQMMDILRESRRSSYA